jgi:hypothetical protein
VTIDELLSLLTAVRRTSRGWKARCPAHADRDPSLSIGTTEDGTILLNCFAGCEPNDICRSLGRTLADLFSSTPSRSGRGLAKAPARRPSDWRTIAGRLEDHAMSRWFRAESILKAATNVDGTEWTDDERDVAMNAVAKAHEDQRWSALLEGVAFRLRSSGLAKEHQ